MKRLAWVLIAVVYLAAQTGYNVGVGGDGRTLTLVSAPPVTVFGSPDFPGCIAQPDGSYILPVTPKTVAIYRNGLRASTLNEYTLSGQSFTFASPIPGETVLCDYTY